ncbi:hypothetical protein HDU99_010027, partial [Rhizoclosmatium hyalinum]
ITEEEFNTFEEMTVGSSTPAAKTGAKRAQDESHIDSPPTAPATASTSPTPKPNVSQAPESKIARISVNLIDSPAHTLSGVDLVNANPAKRMSEPFQSRMNHTNSIMSSFILASRLYAKKTLRDSEFMESAVDVDQLPRFIKFVPNFRDEPNYAAFQFPVLRHANAHNQEGRHIPWSGDFVFQLHSARASIVLHTIAKDQFCKSNLTTDEGARVDKVLVVVGAIIAGTIPKNSEVPFDIPKRVLPVTKSLENQGYLTPLDLGIKELGPWKPFVRKLLRTVHDELLRVLRLLDELPRDYYHRELESLLERMGIQDVDRRTDT